MYLSRPCVPAFPILTRNSPVSHVGHPVPIDLREVRKLCELEQTRVGTHFECVRKAPRKSLARCTPADVEPSAGTALRVTTATGLIEESPPTLYKAVLAYPLWERLSPTVVIRRRPERMQGLGLT
mgnify:CR=1 FL=1